MIWHLVKSHIYSHCKPYLLQLLICSMIDRDFFNTKTSSLCMEHKTTEFLAPITKFSQRKLFTKCSLLFKSGHQIFRGQKSSTADFLNRYNRNNISNHSFNLYLITCSFQRHVSIIPDKTKVFLSIWSSDFSRKCPILAAD